MAAHKVLLLGEQGRVLDSLFENLKKYCDVTKSEIGTAENERIITEDKPDLIIVYFTDFVKWKLFPIKKTTEFLVKNNISVIVAAQNEDIKIIENYLSDINVVGVPQPAATKAIIEMMDKIFNAPGSKNTSGNNAFPNKKNILVIENDIQTIKLIHASLGMNYDVNFAKTVVQGFIRSASRIPDVILFNYSISECSGKYVMKMFREADETKDIPIICLENATNVEAIKECIAQNPAGCLLKPIERKYLVDEVMKVIG